MVIENIEAVLADHKLNARSELIIPTKAICYDLTLKTELPLIKGEESMGYTCCIFHAN